jgi:hypothetical protein
MFSRRRHFGSSDLIPLRPNAAREDCVCEFGGRSAHGSAGAEQNELDGAEIGQTVTARHLGEVSGDQTF